MKLQRKLIDMSRWDSYAVLIILLSVVFQAFRWCVLPTFIDIYYHLLTAVGFNEAGGWVGRCFWEYAPVGRPQIYPPLLHIMMLLCIKLGVPILIIGKLTQFVIYPLTLFVIWYVVKKIFDKKLALFILCLIFSIYSFYLTTIITTAASLSIIFCFLSLLFLERRRIITSALLFALSFYSHGFTPWLFFIFFILYGLFERNKFKNCLQICVFALLLSSPILWHQAVNLRYYGQPTNLVENCFILLHIPHWILLPFGLITCLKKKGKYYIFVSLFIAFIFLLLAGYIERYLAYYAAMTLVFMNAVFLLDVFTKSKEQNRKILLIAMFVLFFISSPTLTIDLWEKYSGEGVLMTPEHETIVFRKNFVSLCLLDSSLINFLHYKYFRSNETSIYFPKLLSEVTEVIKSNTREEDIIYSNYKYTSGILALLSSRVTSNAMLQEIHAYELFDEIAASKLIIWQKDPDDMRSEPLNIVDKYGLNKISETKIAFIYENPKCIAKKQKVEATIDQKVLYVLILLVILAIWKSSSRLVRRTKILL